MPEILTGNFAVRGWTFWQPRTIRVVDWNIERGLKLPDILDFLAAQDADLLLLQEVDLNTRRTGRRNVAEEIARKLRMDYVLGCEFEELAEGSRASPAFIGQATLSRWPLANSRLIRFQRQSGFWHPRWWVPNAPIFQERRGGRIALVTDVSVGNRTLITYNLHLESRGEDGLRLAQLQETLADAAKVSWEQPLLLAGDLNFEAMQTTPIFQQAGFSDVIAQSTSTTPPRGLFRTTRSIDRAEIRGPVIATEVIVDNSTLASDHLPLVFHLQF